MAADAAVLLDIGGDVGALVVHTAADLVGEEIEISRAGETRREHTVVRWRGLPAEARPAGVFPALREGSFVLHGVAGRPTTPFQVAGGRVSEVHWVAEP